MSRIKEWGDFDFATEVQAAANQGPRLSLHLFLFTIVAFLAIGIFWASRAMVDEVTRGEGRVIPSSQLQVVQSLEGGIVEDILVHEGELVQQGQVMLRIDDTGFSSSLGELRVQKDSLTGQIYRLEAEIAGAEEINFPANLPEAAPQVVLSQRTLFEARRNGLENQLSILRQQAEQREQELQELKSKAEQFESSLALAQQELNIYAPLARSGVVPEVEVLRLRREVNELNGQLQATRLSIPRAESAIREAYERIQEQFLTFRSEALKELAQVRSELAVIEESLLAAS
ncbi:MAG TPA: biotin/lipoyl-binding protein, partial [Alphaproteobacteria bacterium]|nr:biotin/lipoyl-binding protein [Alphaproteobacteria bacterium]